MCVTPDLVATAVAALGDSAVRIASVAGAFPSGRTLRAIKVAEVAAAVEAGADEIDAVLDRAALADDRPGDVVDDVAALRGACGGARLKVILETGALPTLEQVRRACWLALIGGADMVKTSTGTVEPGATPAAVLVLLDVARAFGAATGRQAGVKAAGGVRSPQDAAGYLRLARAVAGRAGTSPERLRIGASSLLDALVVARHTAGTPRDGTAGAGP